jgi:hypothetical protein
MTFKSIFFLLLICISVSCVSSKKYKTLQAIHLNTSIELEEAKSRISFLDGHFSLAIDTINMLNLQANLKEEKILSLKNEVLLKEENINNIKQFLEKEKEWNEYLISKNEDLLKTNKSYGELTKNLVENLENQNLRVLNLALALEKSDTSKVAQVRKSKRELTDQKYKKALEKLGFVFN